MISCTMICRYAEKSRKRFLKNIGENSETPVMREAKERHDTWRQRFDNVLDIPPLEVIQTIALELGLGEASS